MNIDLIINKLLEDINVLNAKKSEIILKAAEDLEKEGFEPSKICAKLTQVLKDKVTERHIRNSLPEKYKQIEKIRNPPPKQRTDGTTEEEKEVINFKEQPDVKIGHDEEPPQDNLNDFEEIDNDEPKQAESKNTVKHEDNKDEDMTNNEDRFKAIEDKLKEFDKIIKIKDNRIHELEHELDTKDKVIKEKDIEINSLKGQLAMKTVDKAAPKKLNATYTPPTSAPSMFTTKPKHEDYDKTKYLLKKPKT